MKEKNEISQVHNYPRCRYQTTKQNATFDSVFVLSLEFLQMYMLYVHR